MIGLTVDVLLVDDEPDVLEVSKLALKRMSVYGMPLRVFTAGNKQEAIEFFETRHEATYIALAIIDVVMETNTAGLELCDYIRNERGNYVLPIIVRTGQAGLAPEREVIDRYDISGYIEKVNADEQRLYSLVKGAAREFERSCYHYYSSKLNEGFLLNCRDKDRFVSAVTSGLQALTQTADGINIDSTVSDHAMMSPRFCAGTGIFEDADAARSVRDEMMKQPGRAMGDGGDKIVISDQHMLVHIAANGDCPESADALWGLGAPPPEFVVRQFYDNARQLQMISTMVPW